MSHFTTLVAVPKGKDLDDVMLPYHEYESTGIEQYVEWVDDIHDEHLKQYNTDTIPTVLHNGKVVGSKYSDVPEIKNMWVRDGIGISSKDEFVLPSGYDLVDMPANKFFSTFDEYMQDWCGYKTINPETGKYERRTNPNSKWDWYEVGGRWNNYLKEENEGLVSEWSFESIRLNRLSKRLDTRLKWRNAREKVTPDQLPDGYIDRIAEWFERNDDAKKLYNGNALECALDSRAFDNIDWHLSSLDDHRAMMLSDEEYIKQHGWDSLVHSFIDEQGKWHERGDMGWWGMCNDENTNTYDGENGEFWSFIKSLNPQTMLYLVDCHI